VMLNQIFSAEYTFPDFVSAECRDIISRLIQVNPDGRPPLDELLMHPWFKIPSKARILKRPGMQVPQRLALPVFMEAIFPKRKSVPKVIISPFGKCIDTPSPATDEAAIRPMKSRSLRDVFAHIKVAPSSSAGETIMCSRSRSLLPDIAEVHLLGERRDGSGPALP
jgi:serine/threonine protein kinase